MPDTEYFWQGGRKIQVRQDESQVTIHAENEGEARVAAERAGLDFALRKQRLLGWFRPRLWAIATPRWRVCGVNKTLFIMFIGIRVLQTMRFSSRILSS